MEVTWDQGKALVNLKKHGVSFEEAATVVLNRASGRFDDNEHGEDRTIAVGHSAKNRVLLVVYIEYFGEEIRIISARRATKKERTDYEEGV